MTRRMKRQALVAGVVLLVVCAALFTVLYYLMRSVLGGEYW